MRRLLFVSFRHRSHARSAVRELERSASADAERSVREHDDGLDPLVAVDLVGCQAQEERERRSILRFLPVFAFFALAGAVIDLFALPSFAGFAATMLLGSIGVAVGTVAVLMDAPQPLELAFRDVDNAFAKGETVLTVPLTGAADGAAERTLREHGGRTLFDA